MFICQYFINNKDANTIQLICRVVRTGPGRSLKPCPFWSQAIYTQIWEVDGEMEAELAK